MNIGIVGTGRMGQTVIRLAEQDGHRIVACCNSASPPARSLEDLVLCDAVVDFSHPQVAVEHISLYAENGIPAIIGTTGWHDQFGYVMDLVEREEASILYAANFSIGIAIVKQMLKSVRNVDSHQFDLDVHEVHHVNKVDAPSGTAIELAKIVGVRKSEIQSQRRGQVLGRHEVEMRSVDEVICLSHEVQNRDVFARGALLAASWLVGRRGFYTFDDVFENAPQQSVQILN